jgi:ribosomal protein S18 acetylase RimI-like enzyme
MPDIEIRKATKDDCLAIAELAMMAGEGIPAFFWEQSRQADERIEAVGARNAASETDNFSYRNAWLGMLDGDIAGMLLAYRLPEAEDAEDLEALPEFIRPLVELEHCVPGSFYINMLATYPKYRNRSVGTQLMGIVDELAAAADCTVSSIEVFSENTGALKLYERLGYRIIETRPAVPHPCHPHTEKIVLLTREVGKPS